MGLWNLETQRFWAVALEQSESTTTKALGVSKFFGPHCRAGTTGTASTASTAMAVLHVFSQQKAECVVLASLCYCKQDHE